MTDPFTKDVLTMYYKPDWLYKPVNIPDSELKIIRLELLKFTKEWSKFHNVDFNSMTSQFIGIDRIHRDFLKDLPALTAYLTRRNLTDLVSMIALIVVSKDTHFPIHIDCDDPSVMSFGLNIPVLNCDGSRTVWYSTATEQKPDLPEYISTTYHGKHAINCIQEGAVEIGSCNANIPHWVNVGVPHAPVCDHDKLRINASIRFDPMIYQHITDDFFT